MQRKMLSVIIPYCNQDQSRLPALEIMLDCIKNQDFMCTDHNNTPINGQRAFEFIFIEQKNSNDYQVVDTKGIPDEHIVVEHHGLFNKSWLMNIAARKATQDVLVFMDADTIFGTEYLYFVNHWRINQKPTPKFFIGWDWIIKLPGRDEPTVRMVRSTALTAGGIFWINKDFFWEAGGMNENYFGYGGEDNDFWVRANFLLGKRNLKNVSNAPYPLAHIYHHTANPSADRFFLLDRTVQYTQEVINKLKAKSLGQVAQPTLCDFSDLVLTQPGIESKENSRGLL